MKTIPQKILTHNVDSNLVKIPTILPSSSPLTRQHIKLKFPTITMTKSYTYQRLSRKTLQGRKRYEQMTKVSRKITRHSSFNLQTLLEAPHDSLNTFLIINKWHERASYYLYNMMSLHSKNQTLAIIHVTNLITLLRLSHSRFYHSKFPFDRGKPIHFVRRSMKKINFFHIVHFTWQYLFCFCFFKWSLCLPTFVCRKPNNC